MFGGFSSYACRQSKMELDLSNNPGAPFPLSLELKRIDGGNEDGGPATVVVRVREGAPWPMTVRVAAEGGSSFTKEVTIVNGEVESETLPCCRRRSDLAPIRLGTRCAGQLQGRPDRTRRGPAVVRAPGPRTGTRRRTVGDQPLRGSGRAGCLVHLRSGVERRGRGCGERRGRVADSRAARQRDGHSHGHGDGQGTRRRPCDRSTCGRSMCVWFQGRQRFPTCPRPGTNAGRAWCG